MLLVLGHRYNQRNSKESFLLTLLSQDKFEVFMDCITKHRKANERQDSSKLNCVFLKIMFALIEREMRRNDLTKDHVNTNFEKGRDKEQQLQYKQNSDNC